MNGKIGGAERNWEHTAHRLAGLPRPDSFPAGGNLHGAHHHGKLSGWLWPCFCSLSHCHSGAITCLQQGNTVLMTTQGSTDTAPLHYSGCVNAKQACFRPKYSCLQKTVVRACPAPGPQKLIPPGAANHLSLFCQSQEDLFSTGDWANSRAP